MMNLFKQLVGGGTSSINPHNLHEKMSTTPKPYILDVRQPNEFSTGHIAGANLIPLHELSAKISKLPRDREIICVCRSGARSGVAARQLAAQGFNAINMRGGMLAWQRHQLPTKKGHK